MNIYTKMSKLTPKLTNVLRSKWFFRVTLAWFGLQSVWVAFSSLYPMAFDEQHHFDLINMYAHKWLPFWTSVPDGSSAYGAIARDPSYMFHYLLSFPFRLLSQIVSDQAAQVVILRLVCVAMFIVGIWLFHKLLRRSGLSQAATNVTLALFCAMPVSSLLAGQINYDNMLFMLIPACLLYVQKIYQTLQTKHTLDVGGLVRLSLLAMLASLVKYSFLPVLLAVGMVLMYGYVRNARGSWAARRKQLTRSLHQITPKAKIVLATSFVVLFGFCIERYGVNVARYHTPAPECDQVLTIDECLQFGPWRRNYYTHQSKLKGETPKFNTTLPYFFTKIWFDKSNYHLFDVLNGPKSSYELGQPVPILHGLALKLSAVGIVLFLGAFWRTRKQYQLGWLLFIAGIYTLTLLMQNYLEFLHLGYPFGIQGRYLVPFLPIAGAALATGYCYWLRKFPGVKTWLAAGVVLVFLTQGGGAATFIVRSGPNWYWPDQTIVNANDTARHILKPVIVGE